MIWYASYLTIMCILISIYSICSLFDWVREVGAVFCQTCTCITYYESMSYFLFIIACNIFSFKLMAVGQAGEYGATAVWRVVVGHKRACVHVPILSQPMGALIAKGVALRLKLAIRMNVQVSRKS